MIKLFFTFFFSLLMVTNAYALDSCVIPSGKTYVIDEHTECREVTNSNGQSIMVPTKTANEWSTGGNSFIDNTPSNVSLAACSGTVSKSFFDPADFLMDMRCEETKPIKLSLHSYTFGECAARCNVDDRNFTCCMLDNKDKCYGSTISTKLNPDSNYKAMMRPVNPGGTISSCTPAVTTNSGTLNNPTVSCCRTGAGCGVTVTTTNLKTLCGGDCSLVDEIVFENPNAMNGTFDPVSIYPSMGILTAEKTPDFGKHYHLRYTLLPNDHLEIYFNGHGWGSCKNKIRIGPDVRATVNNF